MDTTPQQPQPEDDWLLTPRSTTEPMDADVIGDAPVQATDVAPRHRRSQLVGASGLVAAGLVAGVIGTFALGHHGSTTTTFQPAGSTTQQGPGGGPAFPPGTQGGTTQQGQGQQGFGGPMGGGPGGMAGEEHVHGTVAGVSGSTLRVATSSGTTSYTVTPGTEVIRNGQVASLAQLKTGDPVLVHVLTAGGSPVVERVIAGTMAQGGFPGGDGGTIDG